MRVNHKSMIVICLILTVFIFCTGMIPPEIVTIPAEAVEVSPVTPDIYPAQIEAQATTAPPETEATTEPQLHYTEVEAVIMAKLLWREGRGVSGIYCDVSPEARQAAVLWCVLNRLDNGSYGDSIVEVVTAPNQFAYDPQAPVDEELLWLANDVLTRWSMEKNGETDVGRTLPADYYFFLGDGEENHFRKGFKDYANTWDWSLPDPYLNADT